MTETAAVYTAPERYTILSNEAPAEAVEVEQIPTGEEVAGTESESEVESEVEQTPEVRKKDAQSRIRELANKAKAEKDRADRAEAALAARAVVPADKPNPADYVGGRYNDDYQDDLDKWRDSTTQAKIDEAIVQRERDRAVNSQKAVIAEREAEFKAIAPDYEEMIAHALPLFDDPLTNTAITEIENITEIAYTIGKDPELLAQFERMTPSQRLVKMGMMSAQGGIVPTQKTARISQAAKPITPVSGGKTVSTGQAAIDAALKHNANGHIDYDAYRAAVKAAK